MSPTLMLAALLASLITAAPPSHPGLLLGVRSKEGLQSFLVDGSALRKVGAGVLMPVEGQLWSVDVEHSQGIDRLVVKVPGGRELRSKPPPPMHVLQYGESPECAHPTLKLELLAVSPNVISWEQTRGCDFTPEEQQSQSEEDEAMIHRPYDWQPPPFDDPSLWVVTRPTQLTDLSNIPLSELGAPAKKALDKVLGTRRNGDPDQWAIVRARGQWVARVKARPWGVAESEEPKVMTLGPVLPDSLIGSTALAAGFDRIAKEQPGTTDAVSSNGEAIQVRLSRTGLTAEAGKNTIGSVSLTAPAIVFAFPVEGNEPWLEALQGAKTTP